MFSCYFDIYIYIYIKVKSLQNGMAGLNYFLLQKAN